MNKKTIVNNGWMTDVAIASDEKIGVNDELFRSHITHPDVYVTLYSDVEVNDDNSGVDSNDVNEPVVVDETPEVVDETPEVVDEVDPVEPET